MKVVICGGGIIGVSTAHFLAVKGIDSVIIEANSIACGASGNAGGFLARHWCDHNEMGALARFSYDLHMKLADELPDCDYRNLDTLEVNVTRTNTEKNRQSLPNWINGDSISDTKVMGTTSNTAQVHPRKLCEALLARAQSAANVTVKIARVTGFSFKNRRVVDGVEIRTEDGKAEVEPADAVVIAMGPWSGEALRWFGKAVVVTGRRAHGIVLKPKTEVTPHALFVEVFGRGKSLSSENFRVDRYIEWNRTDNGDVKVYPRPDGTIYMCGMSDSEELPSTVRAVKVSEEIVKKIKTVGDQVSSVIADSTVERKQACYMPTSIDHFPMIGLVSGKDNAYIGTGHGCWGILNGPGTGMILADLIANGRCDLVNIAPFAPVRLLG